MEQSRNSIRDDAGLFCQACSRSFKVGYAPIPGQKRTCGQTSAGANASERTFTVEVLQLCLPYICGWTVSIDAAYFTPYSKAIKPGFDLFSYFMLEPRLHSSKM